MSLVRTAYTLACDRCNARFAHGADTPARVRANAKRHGWARVHLSHQDWWRKSDLCPKCLEQWLREQ
jgi:hypothetical protein